MSLGPGALLLKDPGSVEPYGFDWTAWLVEIATEELITGSQWAVLGPDAVLSVNDESIVTGNLQTQVTLEGGTPGLRYTVTNRITTSSGYTDERSFAVKVEQR